MILEEHGQVFPMLIQRQKISVQIFRIRFIIHLREPVLNIQRMHGSMKKQPMKNTLEKIGCIGENLEKIHILA